MAKTVNIYEAKTRLSEFVQLAAAGEEIIIAKAGKPMAMLVPLRAAPGRRAIGRWSGQMTIADDFDAPLPKSLLRLFEGDDEP